jgi:hypothetical protein
MIKVVPFIQTTGDYNFKKFIARPFTIDMLYPVFNENSCETLFSGWTSDNLMPPLYLFTNKNNGHMLEFRPDKYIIKHIGGVVGYQLPLPKSINHFINDMNRFCIDLYWTEWIDRNFEPKAYLSKDDVVAYYKDILEKIGKGNELQIQ